MTVQARRASHAADASIQTDGRANACSRPDLEQLMTGYQKADVVAMTALVELLSAQLYRFFAAQTRSGCDADYMLREVWLHIHAARHTYRPGEPLIPWVYAIARRVCTDNYHKRDRVAMCQMAAGVRPGAPAEDGKGDALPSFDALVAALPPDQRELLILLNVNGLTHEEIARATASTVRAVKQKIRQAYKRLRDLLQERATAAAPR